MRTALNSAFILHQRPYKETSLILEVFSRDHGRLSLVAKGARRNKNKSQALFQANRYLNISWVGRGEMGTLAEIEANGLSFDLDGEAIIATFYLNELLTRLLHKHESHPSLFDAYLMALTRLQHGESVLVALRYFEKHLLDSLGYGLILGHEIESGEPIQVDQRYYYSIDRGPYSRKPPNCTCIEISGRTLTELLREEFNEHSSLEEVRQLMRLTLNGYLGDKPLASRDLFRAYIQQKQNKAQV